MSLLMDWRTCERHVIRGLDHLGVSAFSIAVYNILLPGVTNVTDRARYYSFYPWIIHAYAAGARSDDRRKWLTWFRRLDFTYALASTAADLRGRGSARGVVGADRARELLRNGTDASAYDVRPAADLDADGKVPKGAYFKNPQGGYGQYYKAVLRNLGLFFEDEEYEYPDMQLTTYAGLPLAQSVESQPAFTKLRDMAAAGSATFGDLADVGSQVGPSAIAPDSPEHGLLCRLFWGEDDSLCRAQSPQSREWRHKTLLGLLSFVGATTPPSDDAVGLYRRACAQSRLSRHGSWQPASNLASVMRGWADYQWNEYFNFAMESLLWATVQLLRERPRSAAEVGAEVADMMIAEMKPAPADVASFVRTTVSGGGTPASATSDLQAAVLQDEIEQCIHSGDIAGALQSTGALLGYLVSTPNDDTEPMFSSVPGASELFESHRIHLPAWRRRVRAAERQPLAGFLQQLIVEWVVNRHLRVATRKLATQGVHTFKFAPEEDALVCLTSEELAPGPTNPRLRQGLQALQDLGYITEDAGRLVLTPRGTAKLGGQA